MDERVWSNGGMILTGEREVLGEKYDTAWWQINDCVWRIGGMVLTRETELLGEKHFTACVVDE